MTDPALSIAVPLIAGFEGFTAHPVPDVHKWEIGYGFNYLSDGTAVTAHTPHMTVAQAQAELATLAGRVLAAVREMVHVPMADNQAAALTSFAYNLGTSALRTSTLLRLFNAGDAVNAARYFDGYVYAGGKRLAELVSRRAAERALFETPDGERVAEASAAPNIPVRPAPSNKPVIQRPVDPATGDAADDLNAEVLAGTYKAAPAGTAGT